MKSFKNFVCEMDASMMTTFHQQGINAFRDGKKEHESGYSPNSHNHSEWKKGWNQAKKEHEKRESEKNKKTVKSPFAYTDSDGKHHPAGK